MASELDLGHKRVTVTGGAGFLGNYVVNRLRQEGIEPFVPRSNDYDLRTPEACRLIAKRSDIIIHLAAKMGGIGANRKAPFEFWRDNQLMGVHILDAAINSDVEKVITAGTVCEYPEVTPIPFKEESLWDGYPEPTNGPYGIAKRSTLDGGRAARKQHGLNVVHLLLGNLYGPGDSLKLSEGHVIPDMIMKFYRAKLQDLPTVEVWGTGIAHREFLYVDDAAEAFILATKRFNEPQPINIGSGQEVSIKDLVLQLKDLIGYRGQIVWDSSKPDGQIRRRMDTTKALDLFGFQASTLLSLGLQRTVDWYVGQLESSTKIP